MIPGLVLSVLFSLISFEISHAQASVDEFHGEAVLVPDSVYQYQMSLSENLPLGGSFRSDVNLNIKEADRLSVELYDKKGNHVYEKDFGLIESGKYTLLFTDADTVGIFLVRINLEQTNLHFTKSIIVRPQIWLPPEKPVCPQQPKTLIDGGWVREYSHKNITPLQPTVEDRPIVNQVNHQIRMKLNNGYYEIDWQGTYPGNTEEEKFRGCYEVKADTVVFYESTSNKSNRAFLFIRTANNLTLSHIPKIDTESGFKVVPLDFTFRGRLALEGTYHESVQ